MKSFDELLNKSCMGHTKQNEKGFVGLVALMINDEEIENKNLVAWCIRKIEGDREAIQQI